MKIESKEKQWGEKEKKLKARKNNKDNGRALKKYDRIFVLH